MRDGPLSAADYQSIYVRLGRLLESVPAVRSTDDISAPATMLWLGRVTAALQDAQMGAEVMEVNALSSSQLHSSLYVGTAFSRIVAMAYRGLALCESKSPAAMAGSFIPVGSSFDAFSALSKIFGQATVDVLIVDPYMDETALTDFGLAVPSGVTLRLLADASSVKPTLAPAAARWQQQHGVSRPLQVRLAAARVLHDRAIFVDSTKAWTLTQSLKDFAKRSPAEIIRADDTASMKIAAYEAIWQVSRALP